MVSCDQVDEHSILAFSTDFLRKAGFLTFFIRQVGLISNFGSFWPQRLILSPQLKVDNKTSKTYIKWWYFALFQTVGLGQLDVYLRDFDFGQKSGRLRDFQAFYTTITSAFVGAVSFRDVFFPPICELTTDSVTRSLLGISKKVMTKCLRQNLTFSCLWKRNAINR